jgi:putative iron-dependent peroxidase
MPIPQPGVFALGTAAQAFLEFDAPDASPPQLAAAVAGLREPRTTIGGVNLVIGFRPELWRAIAAQNCPDGLHGFAAPITGDDGFTIPATQHDLLLWISGSAYDVIFDIARDAIATLAPTAGLAHELTGWPYRHDRDLTGFIDGTENPTLGEACELATVPAGQPGAAGTVLLLQQWAHNTPSWEALSVGQQQQVMGRTKPDSIELDDKPADSHIARTDQDELGKIFRRNMPYGNVTEHGTIFVGLSADQHRLHRMLERMAGRDGEPRDALTLHTTPLTGSYYFVPAIHSVRAAQPSDKPSTRTQNRR